jgi:glutamate/tyrosine decarboxylase-like PLP-dependent enzyme
MSFQIFGAATFRTIIDRTIELAEMAERRLRQSARWEILSPAQMAVVAFRHVGDDAVNSRLAAELKAGGYAFLSTTTLRGRVALRLCTINPRTTAKDILETIDGLERLIA